MSNNVLLFLKVALFISFLSVPIASCSKRSINGYAISPGSPEDTPTQSYKEPVINETPLEIENVESPEATLPGIQPFFYVSKEGNNTDGRSWETAWNELDQIQWEETNPGDTIVIAGGEYHTQLAVKKSGTLGLPITLTTNGETVVLDGQRPALPYCGQTNYIAVPGDDAIDLEAQSFIVIDGRDWSGIVIRNHSRGIKMREQASNITVRNVEMYNNGYTRGSASYAAPSGPGVRLGGSNVLFEQVIIHDNGQDAFQVGWGVWNFTLRNSWLYNSREHPTLPGQSFNFCTHTDGLQIYDGGLQGPVVIENSIIGPYFTQGIIIGSKATVNNVVIRNTLFVGSENAGIIISDGGQSSSWTLEHVTVVQDATHDSWSVKLNGSGHRIRNSILWGGPWGIGAFDVSEASGNYRWQTPDRYGTAEEMDPMFVDADYSLVQGKDFADFDFTVQNPAIPPGTGSSITSVKKLFNHTQ
jgi:hypothetical protein